MALAGYNGDNETNIISSKSISYSLYDENNIEIPVSNQVNPLVYWIAKDTSVSIPAFSFINALNSSTNATSPIALSSGAIMLNGFMVSGFKLIGTNVSIHIQIKPNSQSVAYLALTKFGDNPYLNTSNKYYDLINVFCPNDLINEGNDSFYLIFANMTKVNSFKGYVGYSLIEISTQDINCFNKSFDDQTLNKLIYKFQNMTNANQSAFTDNYWIRTYTSGCYYKDSANKWSSYGMEILADTNLTHTHCTSNHLTEFAGGFIVLPNAIDFNNVWANASFLKNPVIYSTVIAIVSLYILLGVWARYMDSKDSQKVGITVLGDVNNKTNKYAYEIIVFTGNRLNAGTRSKVSFVLLYDLILH